MNCIEYELSVNAQAPSLEPLILRVRAVAAVVAVALSCSTATITAQSSSPMTEATTCMPHSELVSKTLNLRLSPSMIKVELKAKMVKELQPLTVILRAAARPEFSLMRVPLAVTLKMGLLKADIIEICPISYVSSCFGAGYWIEDYGWSESDAWSE